MTVTVTIVETNRRMRRNKPISRSSALSSRVACMTINKPRASSKAFPKVATGVSDHAVEAAK